MQSCSPPPKNKRLTARKWESHLLNEAVGLHLQKKKTLVPKRLIPLVVSLLVLGGAVAIHLLIPLPSSRELMGLMEIALTISPRNLRHDKVGNKSDFLLLRKLTLKI